MKNIIFGLHFIIMLFLLGCMNTNKLKSLNQNQSAYYPIGENGKWGFANKKGETVITPIFDTVHFFHQGLAVAKINEKFGFINKDGNWHIKPKYQTADNFVINCASVSTKKGAFFINLKGRKVRNTECKVIGLCGNGLGSPTKPEEHFVMRNGKYEVSYQYYFINDSLDFQAVKDTTNFQLDHIEEYSRSHLLVKKDDKTGFFDVGIPTIVVSGPEAKEEAREKLWAQFKLEYDDIQFNRFTKDSEVNLASVRIGDQWKIIDRNTKLRSNGEYYSIRSLGSLTLVEYEPGRCGYIKLNGGKEYFKRNQ